MNEAQATYRPKRAIVVACEGCGGPIYVSAGQRRPPKDCGCHQPPKPKPAPQRAKPKEFSGLRAAARALIPALIERDGLTCQLCQEAIDPTLPRFREDKGLQVDHRHPLSKGGTNALDNLQLAHWRCNNAKGASLT